MRSFTSIFSQSLAVSSADFAAAVRRHAAERAAKGFDCWTQFVAMLFCQLGRAHSPREICSGLASVEGKLNHLGVAAAPRRPTLSHANAVRIQIRTALIAILLLKFLQMRSRIARSLSNLVALLRLDLSAHKDLWQWPDAPLAPPPEFPGPMQADLSLC